MRQRIAMWLAIGIGVLLILVSLAFALIQQG